MARHTLLRVGVLLLALAHATASQPPPLATMLHMIHNRQLS
jgi:hypothetical protein